MSSNTDAQSVEPEQQSVRIPIMQRVLDNPFFLLFLTLFGPARWIFALPPCFLALAEASREIALLREARRHGHHGCIFRNLV